MNGRSRALGLGGLVAVSLLALAWPLRAAPIEPPVPPVPPPPAELQPVFEVIAPIASPECGNATLVVALLPTAEATVPLPGGFPVNVLPLFGPALVVCGSVPIPGTRLQCSPDAAAASALNQAAGAAAGIPVPVDSRVVGPAVQEIYVVQDNVPAPLSSAGLGDTVAGTLTCTNLAAPAPAQPPVEETPPAEAAEPPPADLGDVTAGDSAVSGFTTSADLSAAGSTSPVDQIVSQSQRPIVQAAQVSGGGPGFAYPVILALPLLLLALGGYLGWVLTRPVVPTQR